MATELRFHLMLGIIVASLALSAAEIAGASGERPTGTCAAPSRPCAQHTDTDEVSLMQVTHQVRHSEGHLEEKDPQKTKAKAKQSQAATEEGDADKSQDVLDRTFYKDTTSLRNKFIILDPHVAIAISLLFAVSMVMGMVYLVNWPDWDMRFYSWLMISTTISIFVAVLLFQAINTVAIKTVFKDSSRGVLAFWNVCQMLIYYTAMQVLTSRSSGSFRFWTFWAEPFDRNAVLWQDGKLVPQSVADQKQAMMRQTRAWSLCFAHATGFAALNCGGSLQHAMDPEKYPAATFVIPFVMLIFCLIIFYITRSARLHYLNMSEQRRHLSRAEKWKQGRRQDSNADPNDEWGSGGKVWAFETWDDETYDAEEDLSAVSISFLLVQSIRLSITGRLPSNFGVEEKHYMHDTGDNLLLLFCGLLFLFLHIVMVLKKSRTDEWGRLGKRIWIISQSTCSMTFAWCFLYASQYAEAVWLPKEAPWTITERVILAFCLSVAVFIVIFLLDRAADWGLGQAEVFFNIIMALAILVGFSWEQCFDRAVEVIGETTQHPILIHLALAFGLGFMVFIPWRRHVLGTVLKYEDERLTCGSGEAPEARSDKMKAAPAPSASQQYTPRTQAQNLSAAQYTPRSEARMAGAAPPSPASMYASARPSGPPTSAVPAAEVHYIGSIGGTQSMAQPQSQRTPGGPPTSGVPAAEVHYIGSIGGTQSMAQPQSQMIPGGPPTSGVPAAEVHYIGSIGGTQSMAQPQSQRTPISGSYTTQRSLSGQEVEGPQIVARPGGVRKLEPSRIEE